MNKMDNFRLELIRSNTDFHSEKNEMKNQMSKLRLDFDIYKNKCEETELDLKQQISLLKSVN